MSTIVTYLIDHWILGMGVLVVLFLVVVAVYDVLQTKHQILHNFPVVGHLRYWLETIGPEMRQYFVAQDKEEMPFNRDERSWIYATAKGENSTFGFGTTEQLYDAGYPIIKHAAFPFPESQAAFPDGDKTYCPVMKIMGPMHGRRRPYHPRSVINISAMSFGSLGERAISALNQGAREAHCFHNSGEGGISPYHEFGAEMMWQLGTGYFGARTADGEFSLDRLAAKCESNPNIRCIEIKLSQGAKPGKGGILPGKKVTPEIAAIRGIPIGKDCISPNGHSAFSTVDEMIDFIEILAERTGLPIGIKSAIGEIEFWQELADRMKVRGEGPDFLSIDGGEGGTGAAPLTFADHVSLPFKIGFTRVYPIFQAAGLSQEILWNGSAKLGFPDRAIVAFALGCDMIAVAREAMFAIGCIQAQKCHTGFCPSGVATQNRWLQGGLNVEDKARRLTRYIQSFRKELLALSFAAGYRHPCQFTGHDIEYSAGVNKFATLDDFIGYHCDPIEYSESIAMAEVEGRGSRVEG